MAKQEFRVDDGVVSILKFPDPCPIRVVVDDERIALFVGPRDWSWRRSNGELIGSGCCVC